MFKTPDEYYNLEYSTRKQFVYWFKTTSRLVDVLRTVEGYENDEIIKLLRSIITKKNLAQIDAAE